MSNPSFRKAPRDTLLFGPGNLYKYTFISAASTTSGTGNKPPAQVQSILNCVHAMQPRSMAIRLLFQEYLSFPPHFCPLLPPTSQWCSNYSNNVSSVQSMPALSSFSTDLALYITLTKLIKWRTVSLYTLFMKRTELLPARGCNSNYFRLHFTRQHNTNIEHETRQFTETLYPRYHTQK